jgi:hypothetical protein
LSLFAISILGFIQITVSSSPGLCSCRSNI